MTHGQNSLKEDYIGAKYDPYLKATRLCIRSFDHGSYGDCPQVVIVRVCR